jgi:hypothetical protein
MTLRSKLRAIAAALLGIVAGCRAPGGAPASRVAAERDEGVLQIYEMMTQNGTVASRTVRDSAGRVVRVVYYGVHARTPSPRGPFAERDLYPLATEIRAYDAAGRLVLEESIDGSGRLVGHTAFSPDEAPALDAAAERGSEGSGDALRLGRRVDCDRTALRPHGHVRDWHPR